MESRQQQSYLSSILIFDDDEFQMELVRDFLQIHLNCTIDWASTGEEFWANLEKKDYAIIFLDYRLQDTNGLDILRELSRRKCRIPVVMVTGQGNEVVAAKSIQEGALDYLIKGEYPLRRLLTLVEKAISTRRLKDAVAESTAKIRYQATLLDNIRDAVVGWDLDGKITFWNPAAFILFGLKPEDVIGKPAEQVYLNAFNPPIWLPAPGDSTGLEIERQYVNSKGQTRWISSRVSVLHDDENPSRILGHIGVSRDITRRKREQQALHESEARYRAIVEDHQTEQICRSQRDSTLTFVNEAFCTYFQKSRDDLIGSMYLDFVLDEDRETIRSGIDLLGREQMVFTCEYRVCLPNGSVRWVESTHRAILDSSGYYKEFQSVGRDITDRKEMEAQLERSRMQLVQSAQLSSIGQLAAGIAHQIYNPLTTVIGESQILMQQFGPDHPACESLKAIVEAGWRSQQIVQQLLEYAQPTPSSLKPVSINQTIRQAIRLVGLNLPDASVQVELFLTDDLPPITCNPQQMHDLWVNLLLLAKAATRDGNAHVIRITSCLDPLENLSIEIQDDGTPVPAEQLSTIFEPSLEPVGGRGNGIELSICREIVRQNRGKIHYHSDRQGTRAQVILPIEGMNPQ